MKVANRCVRISHSLNPTTEVLHLYGANQETLRKKTGIQATLEILMEAIAEDSRTDLQMSQFKICRDVQLLYTKTQMMKVSEIMKIPKLLDILETVLIVL